MMISAMQVDHLGPALVQALVARIEREQGHWIFWSTTYGERIFEWNVRCGNTRWKTACACYGSPSTRTSSPATLRYPLLIKNPGGLAVEMTDGTAEYNNANYRLSIFYDLAKISVTHCLVAGERASAVSLHRSCPDQLASFRADARHYGVSEANWRDAIAKQPHFVITEPRVT